MVYQNKHNSSWSTISSVWFRKATTSTTKATTVSYSTGASTHTVQAGDTLFRIAKNNGLTLSELRALNGLTSNNIRVGQVLKVSKIIC